MVYAFLISFMKKTDRKPKRSSRYAGARRDAFTLVEIMVVVAIIGILAAIGIPSFAKARNQSRISRYLNDIRQVIDYIERYAMDKGAYPPDRMPRQAPDGLHEYVKRFDWSANTPRFLKSPNISNVGHYSWATKLSWIN